MKSTNLLLAASALALLAPAANAIELTFVSWGGAYSKSQQLAYNDPYMAAHPDVTIINDESSPKRAQKGTGAVRPNRRPPSSARALPILDQGLP